MSTSNYKWTHTSQDKNTSQVLQNSLNIPNNVALLLNERGIYDYDQARQFFRPRLDDFFDPFLIPMPYQLQQINHVPKHLCCALHLKLF